MHSNVCHLLEMKVKYNIIDFRGRHDSAKTRFHGQMHDSQPLGPLFVLLFGHFPGGWADIMGKIGSKENDGIKKMEKGKKKHVYIYVYIYIIYMYI